MALIEELKSTFEAIEVSNAPPVIAAVEGACVGGGLELALACDIRIVSERLFCATETKFGMVPDLGGTVRLAQVVGPARLRNHLGCPDL